MTCKFDMSKCYKCDKFSICSFLEVQKQITEISEQINMLLTTTSDLSKLILESKSGLKDDL